MLIITTYTYIRIVDCRQLATAHSIPEPGRDGDTSADAESPAGDLEAEGGLLALVLIKIHEANHSLNGLGIEPGGDDLIGALFFPDVPVENRVERFVGRQAVLVGLIGAKLGRGRLGNAARAG